MNGITLKCEFEGTPQSSNYTCIFRNAIVQNNEAVTVNRYHANGWTDQQIYFLRFEQSKLSHIPNEVFDTFPNLKYLYASNDQLQKIGKLRNCNSLLQFYFVNNQLKELPADSISACKNLQVINVHGNQITRLEPGLLTNFKNFKVLNMKFNKIRELEPRSLETLPTSLTKEFYFNNNPLEKINSSFDKTAKISWMSFANCNISKLPESFLDGLQGSISNLDFRNNICVNQNFVDVTRDRVDFVKSSLQNCLFDDWIGKWICKRVSVGNHYHCSIRAILDIKESKNQKILLKSLTDTLTVL